MKMNNGTFRTFINPQIISYKGIKINHKEKCLSLKKEYKVTRHTHILVTDDYFCKGEENAMIGQEAVIFQHEMDHLNGITIKTRSQK